jgi:hypothetical protein
LGVGGCAQGVGEQDEADRGDEDGDEWEDEEQWGAVEEVGGLAGIIALSVPDGGEQVAQAGRGQVDAIAEKGEARFGQDVLGHEHGGVGAQRRGQVKQ